MVNGTPKLYSTWDKSLLSVPFGFRIANREPNPLLVLVQVLAVLQVLGSGFAESATNWKSRRTESVVVSLRIILSLLTKILLTNTSGGMKSWAVPRDRKAVKKVDVH